MNTIRRRKPLFALGRTPLSSRRGRQISMRGFSTRYQATLEDVEELKRRGKQIVKLIVIILLIKLIRMFTRQSPTAQNLADIILNSPNTTQIVQNLALITLISGVLILGFTFITIGVRLIHYRAFTFIMGFCILDAIFIYMYPEISVNVARAIFFTYQ